MKKIIFSLPQQNKNIKTQRSDLLKKNSTLKIWILKFNFQYEQVFLNIRVHTSITERSNELLDDDFFLSNNYKSQVGTLTCTYLYFITLIKTKLLSVCLLYEVIVISHMFKSVALFWPFGLLFDSLRSL